MTTADVAVELVELCRDLRFVDAVEKLYADDVVSVEALDYQGTGREICGKEAVRGKNVKWMVDNNVHSLTLTGPFVSPERFAVCFSFEWTRRATGERVQFAEVGVYTVADGKVVREEFLYSV
jgi:hypothetical protein